MPPRLLYVYAEPDASLAAAMARHFTLLLRGGTIAALDSFCVSTVEKGQIDINLERADLILFLVSPYLLTSGFFEDAGWQRAQERRKQNKIPFIPIILRPTSWGSCPLAQLMPLPRDGRPVATQKDPDAIWLEVRQEIERVIQHLRPPAEKAPRAPQAESRGPAPDAKEQPVTGPPATPPGPEPTRLFYVYAEQDAPLIEDLAMHLTLLQREGAIGTVDRCCVSTDETWKERSEPGLERADIILILVSPHLLASRYLEGTAGSRAMERRAREEAQLIPILLYPVNFGASPLGSLLALPRHGGPVATRQEPHEAWHEVMKEVRRMAVFGNSRRLGESFVAAVSRCAQEEQKREEEDRRRQHEEEEERKRQNKKRKK